MIPFSYALPVKGRELNGTIYSVTGQYVGGRIGQQQEKIDVRDDSGQVTTVHVNHIIDPPDYCTITLLYFKNDNGYTLFQLYIHETEQFHGISHARTELMLDKTLNISFFGKAWNKILSALMILLMAVVMFAGVFVWRYQFLEAQWAALICVPMMVVLALSAPRITQCLGSTRNKRAVLKTALLNICHDLIASIESKKTKQDDGYRAM